MTISMPSFQLERFFAKYEFNVEYLLCASDCEAWTVQELLDLEDGAAQRLAAHWLGYTESEGSPSLRTAICELYDSMAPGDVRVHSGAEEAIFLFMHAVLQAGDHIIVHWPCYQSLAEVARTIGCDVSKWHARAQLGWALDVDELRALIRPNTRAIVLNTPHNPTGYLMPLAEYEQVHDIVQERGLLLFSDEVYRESEHAPEERLPAACDLGEHAVSLGVLSKSYGLAGLRIGWVATHNRDVLQRMAMMKDYITICSSAPSEFLAELALRQRHVLLARNAGIIRRNLEVLDLFFACHTHRFVWQRPRAGAIAFPRLLGKEVEAFCDDLVRESGVLLAPGTLFGDDGNHFRIGFGRKNMAEAVARLEAYLQ